MNHGKLFFPWVVGRIDSRPGGAADNKGFTLVELLIVVALIGILATLSIPTYNGYINTTRNSRAMSEIRTLSTEIGGYALDKGTNPPDLDAINRGGYLDPWKNSYVYYNIATHLGSALMDEPDYAPLNTDYDLYSKGSDLDSSTVGGLLINKDDIVRSNDGAFVGLRP